MTKRVLFAIGTLIACVPFLLLPSCKKDEVVEDTKVAPVEINISGLAEKGPFLSGSMVKLYLLDDQFNPTGKVYETTTDALGHFELLISSDKAPKYVKLAVNGLYYNEMDRGLTGSPVTLESIIETGNATDINTNVNVLTHLETVRLVELVTVGKKSVKDAKVQAQKELLDAFLIKDKVIVPQTTTITGNNESANILLAVSCILLRGRTEPEFVDFLNLLKADLKDGVVSDANKDKIKQSSYNLGYKAPKRKLIERYQELGKTIEVGNFQFFIDGDGDGKIGTDYTDAEDVILKNIFDDEKALQAELSDRIKIMALTVQNVYLFDALYTNTADVTNLKSMTDLMELYNHTQQSSSSFISGMWGKAYSNIVIHNLVINENIRTGQENMMKYKYSSPVFRAYLYLSMTQIWGDVPFDNQSLLQILPTRIKVSEILDQLIVDLKAAEQNLPEKPEEYLSSKYLATALLARAYLYKKDYTNALLYANKLINGGLFSLEADQSKAFSLNSKESFFSVPINNDFNPLFRPIVNKGNYISLARYAEVLLIAAEANLKLNKLPDAVSKLNLVRSRNGRSLLAATATSQTIQNALLEEYKNDFKVEGAYFFALKRLGIAEQTLGIKAYQTLMPIPISELNLNPNIIQNPGY